MAVTAAQVKELREKTGAGIMDAKRALVETDGNMEAAAELLREKGIAKAEKKADRIAAEGLTGIAVNGNTAALIELNSETDFVAKNEQFVAIVKETAELIAEKKPATNEEALALTTAEGISLEDSYTQATATIGEKISFRRFQLIEKTDAQTFGVYQHNQGRIGVVTVVEGGDAELAKAVAMHIAAMNPTVLSYKELDAEFVHDELAKLNHTIDEDNESRKLVNKPMLPHLAYGSRSQLTEEVLANAEAEMKDTNSIFHTYQKLIQLRKEYEIITLGKYELIMKNDENIYAYKRLYQDEELYVYCNFTDKEVSYDASILNNEKVLIQNYNQHQKGTLKPYESIVFYQKSRA